MVIRNHVGGHFYNYEANQRFFYYPETYAEGQGYAHWMPTVWFEGIDEQTGIWTDVNYTRSVYRDKIVAFQSLPSQLTMDIQVEYGTRGDTGTVQVEVVAPGVVGFTDLHLRLAVIESGVGHEGEIYNQVLRDYLPNELGIPFSIAEGDTFTHSEEFVIQTGWDAEDCHLAAFVQNDAERLVVQCIQAPVIVSTPVVSETPVNGPPGAYQLSQNYPNPFNANTEIRYQISEDGQVTMKIFNALGQEVRTLVDGDQGAGEYSVIWDGRDSSGGMVASGLYFCRLQVEECSRAIKMVLLR